MTPAVKRLLIATIVGFVVQLVGDRATGGRFTLYFGLSRWGMAHLFWWQPATYALLHGGAFHILINMLGLFFLGPETERALGTRRFVILYVASAVLGGLGWLLLSRGGICIGASAAFFGIVGAFAALFPRRLITLFIMLVIPVTLPAWMLAVGLAVVELVYLLAGDGNIAYAAHLAGMAAGYFYVGFLLQGGVPAWVPRLGAYLRSRRHRGAPSAGGRESEARLDRILDKIANQGIGSLTRAERDFLDRMSRGRRPR